MKAQQVFTCIFTDTPPNGGAGAYNIDTLPASDRSLYNAVSDAYAQIIAEKGDQPLLLSMCYAPSPNFSQYLSTVTLSRPFIAMIATYPDGTKKAYATKVKTVKNYVNALLEGEFGGSGIPTNPGDGDGGWGQGDGGLLCKLLPPICALGFLPWLAASVYTTYRAAESRSTAGKAMWGIPAALFWQGFIARGGVQQIKWWMKKI